MKFPLVLINIWIRKNMICPEKHCIQCHKSIGVDFLKLLCMNCLNFQKGMLNQRSLTICLFIMELSHY